ncbi:MAG: hypothetical protein JOZ94_01265 [Xanthobacteraceae bacterium]|nr:hypothetical protein [Xanthobacteraceae bacterium]MBV9626553.1 hypothetical protein [Xanthobacteraceae bacterium]
MADTKACPSYDDVAQRHGGLPRRGRGAITVAAAQQAFRDAMALAARQSCPILELRAANSLARVLGAEDFQQKARDLLAPIYARFTEGFDKSDLLVTKALLTELN